MKLTETRLRKLIRDQIIKEGFLSSGVKSVNSAMIDLPLRGVVIVDALGYSKLIKQRKSLRGLSNYLVVKVKSDDTDTHSALLKQSRIQVLPKSKIINVVNHGTRLDVDPAAPVHANYDFYAIPVEGSESLKDNLRIKVSEEIWDPTGTTGADMAIEALGVVGAVPIIGEPADVVSGLLAITKDPPDYLLAALCFICAIPALGTLAIPAKESIKKAKNIDEAIEAMSEHVPADAMSSAKDWFDELAEVRDVVEEAANILGIEASVISKNMEEVDEICERIFKNFEDTTTKSSKRVDGNYVDLIKAGIQKVVATSMKSLKSGRLRTKVTNDLIKLNRMNNPARLSATRRILKSISSGTADFGDINFGHDMADLFSGEIEKHLLGSSYKVDNKVYSFKSVEEVRSNVIAALGDAPSGLEYWDYAEKVNKKVAAVFQKFARESQDNPVLLREILEERLTKPTTKENIDTAVGNIINSFGNIKVEYTDSASSIDAATTYAYMTLPKKISKGVKWDPDALELVDAPGAVVFEGSTMRITTVALNSLLMRDNGVRAVERLIEHELGHHIANVALASIAYGDEVLGHLLRGVTTESDIFFAKKADSLFVGSSDAIEKVNLRYSTEMLDYLKNNIKDKSTIDEFIKFSSSNANISANRVELHNFLNLFGIDLPIPQLDYLAYRLRDKDVEALSGFGKIDLKYIISQEVLQNIRYQSNAAEAFTIFQGIANVAEKAPWGPYDFSKRTDIKEFFKTYTPEILEDTAKRQKMAYLSDELTDFYKYIFEVAKSKKPGDDEVFERLLDYIQTFV